jgi:HTH-like domain
MKFRFVAAERAQFPVSLLCMTIGVTPAGVLRVAVSATQPAQRPGCGAVGADPPDPPGDESGVCAPRIYLDLRDQGVWVGKNRIARLMRQAGASGADGSRGGPASLGRTEKPTNRASPKPGVLQFCSAAPNARYDTATRWLSAATRRTALASDDEADEASPHAAGTEAGSNATRHHPPITIRRSTNTRRSWR